MSNPTVKLGLLVAGVAILWSFSGADAMAQHFGRFGPGGYFGWPGNLKRSNRDFRLGKADLDADLNYDQVIDNSDPGDGGEKEGNPPGLVLGRGEMTKFVLRVVPEPLSTGGRAIPRLDYDFSKLLVVLSLRGLNLHDTHGRFQSLDQERQYTGRIRIWADKDRKTLLLDSDDPQRRSVVWQIKDRYVPDFVYVEGIRTSTPGSLFHIGLVLESTQPFKSLYPAFDHIVLTVRDQPHSKRPKPEPGDTRYIIVGESRYDISGYDDDYIWVRAH